MQASGVFLRGFRRKRLLQPSMRSDEGYAGHRLPLHPRGLQGQNSLVGGGRLGAGDSKEFESPPHLKGSFWREVRFGEKEKDRADGSETQSKGTKAGSEAVSGVRSRGRGV